MRIFETCGTEIERSESCEAVEGGWEIGEQRVLGVEVERDKRTKGAAKAGRK